MQPTTRCLEYPKQHQQTMQVCARPDAPTAQSSSCSSLARRRLSVCSGCWRSPPHCRLSTKSMPAGGRMLALCSCPATAVGQHCCRPACSCMRLDCQVYARSIVSVSLPRLAGAHARCCCNCVPLPRLPLGRGNRWRHRCRRHGAAPAAALACRTCWVRCWRPAAACKAARQSSSVAPCFTAW